MKRLTKQQVIENLTKQLRDKEYLEGSLREEITKARDSVSFYKAQLADILNKTSFSVGSPSTVSFDRIITAVAQMSGAVVSEARILPHIDHNIKGENAKLWYLIRVAMNDKSIQEPKGYENLRSAFSPPNFDY